MRAPIPVILAAVAALGACGGGGGDPDAAPTSTSRPAGPTTALLATTTTVAEPRILAEVLSGTDDDPAYEYELRYPRLEGLPAAVTGPVNSRLSSWAERTVEEFVAATADAPAPGAGGASSLTAEYRVTLLDPEVLSLIVEGSQYFAGAAHPFGFARAFTFDLATGRELALGDLFRPGAPYLERLSELSRDRLADQLDADAIFDDGLAPVPESFAGWHLGPADLLVTFEQYQVAAGAAGQLTVAIAYDRLEDHIDPAGPLGGRP